MRVEGRGRLCIALIAFIVGFASPATADDQEQTVSVPHNTLAGWESDAGWVLLFDGSSTDGWRGYGTEGLPSGWRVVGGALTVTDPGIPLITEAKYSDFELTFEWQVGPGGSGGVYFRAIEGPDEIGHGASRLELRDEESRGDQEDSPSYTGANAGVQAGSRVTLRPVGEWNTAKLLVVGARVEHWLNGQKVLEYDLWTREWKERVNESPVAGHPEYAMANTGHIGLGSDSAPIAFRDIKIRAIPPGSR